MPDDEQFSDAVKKAGFLVAWPDKPLAEAVGFSPEEFERDPDYYITNYTQKLRNALRLRSSVRNMIRSALDPKTREAMARLFMLYWIKVKNRFTP